MQIPFIPVLRPLLLLSTAAALLVGSEASSAADLGRRSSSVQSFLIHSDTQYEWYDDGKNPDPKPTLDAQSNAIAAWLALHPAGTPVFLNGDVTAYGHGGEWRTMLADLRDPRIRSRYWGLGNHDYANNIRLPDGSGCLNNGCARDSITHLMAATKGWGLDSFDFQVTDKDLFKVHKGSLAYSKTIGEITFIQLHNHYDYAVDFSSSSGWQTYTYKITPSLDWLEVQLEKAKKAGKFVVIHQHRPPSALGTSDAAKAAQKRFAKLIKDYRVLAVFHGHTHNLDSRPVGGDTPVFQTGASFRKTFLTADLDVGRNELAVYQAKENLLGAQPLQTVPLTKVFAPDVEAKKNASGELAVFFFFGNTRRDRKVEWVRVTLSGESAAREGIPGGGFAQLEPMKDYDYTLTAFAAKGGEPLATFKGRFNSGSVNDPPTDLCVKEINGFKNYLTLQWKRPATFPPDQYSFVEARSEKDGTVIRIRGPNSGNQQSTKETIYFEQFGIKDITQYTYVVYYWSASQGHTPRAELRGADLLTSGCATP